MRGWKCAVKTLSNCSISRKAVSEDKSMRALSLSGARNMLQHNGFKHG